MRIAICDDLKTDRQQALEMLDSVMKNFSADEFCNANELLEKHAIMPYDLIITDILMPDISGIDMAAQLRKSDTRTPIVFMSTSEEFGVQSYRVLAFDYLLKPLDKDQFKACIKRLLSQREKRKRYIKITYLGTETNILLSNIQYLESNLRKVIFGLPEGREITVSGKLTDFEPSLLSHGFCRCHKSFLVNIEQIDRIEDDMFYLTGGKTVRISRAYKASARKAYFDYIFNAEELP